LGMPPKKKESELKGFREKSLFLLLIGASRKVWVQFPQICLFKAAFVLHFLLWIRAEEFQTLIGYL